MRKESRLAKRKLGIPSKEKPKKGRSYGMIFVLVFVLSVLALFVVWHFGFFSQWDGRQKFSFVYQMANGDVQVSVLDPAFSTITTINIPGQTEVEAAYNLGTWRLASISKLGRDEGLNGSFLKDTVVKSFGIPLNSYGNFSLIDQIKIKIFKLFAGNSGENAIDLTNTGYLTRVALPDGTLGWEINGGMPVSLVAYFVDPKISNQNLNVEIINKGQSGDEGEMVGRAISAMGANVASITTATSDSSDCVVVGLAGDVVSKIANVFSCQVRIEKAPDNFDIVVSFGSKFTNRF